MATSSEYTEYVFEQLADSGKVTHRNMFGGVGIYLDEVFCALISSTNVFYLRVGPDNIDDFTTAGMAKFPGGKGRGMPYYEVPGAVLEDPGTLAEWAGKARRAALAAKQRR